MDFIDVKLETLSQGYAVANFNEALRRVLEDINDPEKDPEDKRVITLKVTVVADDRLREISYDHSVELKLPGFLPRGGTAYLQHTADGVRAVEVDPGQKTIQEAIDEVDAAAAEAESVKAARAIAAAGGKTVVRFGEPETAEGSGR